MKDIIIIGVMFASAVMVGGMLRSGNGFAVAGWAVSWCCLWYCLVLNYRIKIRDTVIKTQREYIDDLTLAAGGPCDKN